MRSAMQLNEAIFGKLLQAALQRSAREKGRRGERMDGRRARGEEELNIPGILKKLRPAWGELQSWI